jgi:biopolymer transport protein ExbD
MRFPRNATIFRGQLDVAAFAGLFFLLALFLLLASLIYTPGVSIDLTAPGESVGAALARKSINVTRTGEISYGEATYRLGDFERLRMELKKLPPEAALVVSADPSAPREIIVRLRGMARELGIVFDAPGFPIQLPKGENLPGTSKPTFTVAVNLGGQLFHNNQIIQEGVLRERLAAAVQRASPEPLALVVLADEDTEVKLVTRLRLLADEAGASEMLMGVQPRPFAAPPKAFSK